MKEKAIWEGEKNDQIGRDLKSNAHLNNTIRNSVCHKNMFAILLRTDLRFLDSKKKIESR